MPGTTLDLPAWLFGFRLFAVVKSPQTLSTLRTKISCSPEAREVGGCCCPLLYSFAQHLLS